MFPKIKGLDRSDPWHKEHHESLGGDSALRNLVWYEKNDLESCLSCNSKNLIMNYWGTLMKDFQDHPARYYCGDCGLGVFIRISGEVCKAETFYG